MKLVHVFTHHPQKGHENVELPGLAIQNVSATLGSASPERMKTSTKESLPSSKGTKGIPNLGFSIIDSKTWRNYEKFRGGQKHSPKTNITSHRKKKVAKGRRSSFLSGQKAYFQVRLLLVSRSVYSCLLFGEGVISCVEPPIDELLGESSQSVRG